MNHGHIIPFNRQHFFFKYTNCSVQEMISLLKFVSASLEAVQRILLTILLCLKNQYDATLKYVTCDTLVLTLLSFESIGVLLLMLMGVGPLFHCHLPCTLRHSLQQHCQLRGGRAISKYFLMPKANQEMTFSTSSELLICCYRIFQLQRSAPRDDLAALHVRRVFLLPSVFSP